MRKYQKSEFLLLIPDGVWGLFLIETFLKNCAPPPLFSNVLNWNWDISVFFGPPPPYWEIVPNFTVFFNDASPYHFYIICEAGEDEAWQDEDHDQEPQLWHTLCQGEDDGLKTAGMPEDIER